MGGRRRQGTPAPARAVAGAAVGLVVLACQSTPVVAPSGAAVDPTPTPCIDPFACQATPNIQTLPPTRTASPDPLATPWWSASPADTMRIATASCFITTPAGLALEDIARQQPDLLLWLGDNVYADATEMNVLRSFYDTLAGNPRFAALRDSVEMMATWDDHDYGNDNANGTWPFKEASKAEFLRFWGTGADDPRWSQPGVYSAKTFGDGDRTVQVILLDNRYNLDPWDYEGIDPNRQVLGEVQWAWLRERLLEPATIRIIGSGVQVVQDYDISEIWEGWGDSPLQRERLFSLIRELKVPGVVFVSGDMHFAELSRHPDDAAALGYPTWDLTASGLDRIETENPGEWNNPNRIGGLLNSNRKHGIVGIDWAPDDPEIHLQIWDAEKLFLDQVVRLSELQPA